MSALFVAALIAVNLLGAVLLGARLRRRLPSSHLTADTKDSVKLAMGLVATMTALILGLLVSSAKQTYDTARSQVLQMATRVAYLDRLLALYGPEAADTRAQLREGIASAVRSIWPEDATSRADLTPDTAVGDELYVAIHRLSPQDDLQRDLKAKSASLVEELGQLRTLLLVQSVPSISTPLLVAVVGWLVIIFCCFSLVAPPNGTATIAMIAAAVSVAGAVLLILELDQPFEGAIRIPSAPMVNSLSHLAK